MAGVRRAHASPRRARRGRRRARRRAASRRASGQRRLRRHARGELRRRRRGATSSSSRSWSQMRCAAGAPGCRPGRAAGRSRRAPRPGCGATRRVRRATSKSRRCCESHAERKCGSSKSRRIGRSSSVSFRSMHVPRGVERLGRRPPPWRAARSAGRRSRGRSRAPPARARRPGSGTARRTSSSAWPTGRAARNQIEQAVVELEVGREVHAADAWCGGSISTRLRPALARGRAPVASSSAMFES